MARNEEKALGMLNKWTTMKKEHAMGMTTQNTRRPYLASECDDLRMAEKWRRQILGEVSRKVTKIQNASLGESRIRDLNDEINKLLREKGHWERRIKELGGPDHRRSAPTTYDAQGRELQGGKGYKYFGAARDLPSVRELFETQEAEKKRKTRAELYKNVTPDYYGFKDEDDGTLVAAEAELEKVLLREAQEAWRRARGKRGRDGDDDGGAGIAAAAAASVAAPAAVPTMAGAARPEDDDGSAEAAGAAADAAMLEAEGSAGAVPSQEEVKTAILKHKKRKLLEKYGGK